MMMVEAENNLEAEMGKETTTNGDLRIRQFRLSQKEKDENGNVLMSFDMLKKIMIKYEKNIEKYTYILHDRDIKCEPHSDTPILDDDGNTIPVDPHFHIAVQLKTAVPIRQIAKWFSVPINFVNKITGSKYYKYYEVVNYFTHADFSNKTHYETSEVYANYDYEKYIADMSSQKLRRSRRTKEELKEQIRYKVRFEGWSISKIAELYPVLYMEDLQKLKLLRKEYLNSLESPKRRFNFYVCGGTAVGKDQCSYFLADILRKTFFPDLGYDDCVFKVGNEGALFEEYDGQKILIWSDFRSSELLKRLGGRNGVFNMFDTFTNGLVSRQNVKYGSVKLQNVINIVNSAEPYEDFLHGFEVDKDGLYSTNEKADIQANRRFPVILPLRVNDFDVMMNAGYFEDDGSYEDFKLVATIQGSFARLMSAKGNNDKRLEIAGRMLNKPVELCKNGMSNDNGEKQDDLDDLYDVYGFEVEDNKDLFGGEKVDVIDNPFEDNKKE